MVVVYVIYIEKRYKRTKGIQIVNYHENMLFRTTFVFVVVDDINFPLKTARQGSRTTAARHARSNKEFLSIRISQYNVRDSRLCRLNSALYLPNADNALLTSTLRSNLKPDYKVFLNLIARLP